MTQEKTPKDFTQKNQKNMLTLFLTFFLNLEHYGHKSFFLGFIQKLQKVLKNGHL
jgi:hypothetical protein